MPEQALQHAWCESHLYAPKTLCACLHKNGCERLECMEIAKDDGECNVVQVVNFGAWYPRYSVLEPHHTWPAWQTDMKELIHERLSTYKATTFWRSYAAAHYGGTNGTNTFEEVCTKLLS